MRHSNDASTGMLVSGVTPLSWTGHVRFPQVWAYMRTVTASQAAPQVAYAAVVPTGGCLCCGCREDRVVAFVQLWVMCV